MKKIPLKVIGVYLSMLVPIGVIAQESVNVTGGNASGSEGTASYSVGQVFYQTDSDSDFSVGEGVQQPYEITVITSTREIEKVNLSAAVYPNPVTNFLTLNIDDAAPSETSYQLYDVNGEMLKSKQITSSQTRISMSGLTPAIYFVKIYQEGKEGKTFKVVKNQ